MMRRIASVILVLLLAVIAGLIGLRLWVRSEPILPAVTDAIDTAETEPITVEIWCAQELRRVVGPDVRFESLVYVHPRTVVLGNVEATSWRVQLVHAPSVRIDFARTPRVGEPLVVEQIELAEPVVRSVWGLSVLAQRMLGASDSLALRRIALINGTLELADLQLDQITMELQATPADDEPGWYAVNATVKRPEILEVVLDGRFDAVDRVVHVQYGGVEAELDADRFDTLPIVGSIAMNGTGTVHLDDPARTDLEGRLTVSDGSVTLEEVELPLEWLEMSARIDGARLYAEPLYMHVLGGAVRIAGWFDADDRLAGAFTVEVTDVRLGAHPLLQTIFGPMGLGDDVVSHGTAQILIADGAVTFDAIELEGAAATVLGTGEVGYDSISFRFDVGTPPVTYEVGGRFDEVIVKRVE